MPPADLDLGGKGGLGGEGRRLRIPLDAYLHLLVIYLVWGSTYLAVRICVTGAGAVTPFQLQAIRLACAAALLALLTGLRSGLPGRVARRDLGLCAATGILLWVMGNGMTTFAARHAASGFIVIAMGMIPLWTIALDCLIGRVWPRPRVAAGLAIGLAGLGLVMAPPLVGAGGRLVEPGWGLPTAAMLVVAGLTWALGTVLQRGLTDRLGAGWVACFQMATAAVVLGGMAAASGVPLPVPASFSREQVLAFLFLVLFGSVLSMTSYLAVIRSFSPVAASTFAYVNPVVGLFLGNLVLGEAVTWTSVAGLAVILAGVGLVLTARRSRGG